MFKYNYKIVRVDKENKVMDVVYSGPNLTEYTVGVNLPKVGESLDQIIASHAPIFLWERETTDYQVPEVGISGEIDATIDTSTGTNIN